MRSLARVFVSVALLLLAGCTATPRPQPLTSIAFARPAKPALVATPTNSLRTTFVFDASPSPEVTGYKLHWGPDVNSLNNVVDVGLSRTNTIEHANYPIAAEATAYDANGFESSPSNAAGILGTRTIVTGYDQRSASPAGPFTDAGAVFIRTNPPTTFHRLRIASTVERITFP